MKHWKQIVVFTDLINKAYDKETTKDATNIHSSNPSRNSHDIYILSKPKPCHPCRRTNNKQTSEEQKRAKAKKQTQPQVHEQASPGKETKVKRKETPSHPKPSHPILSKSGKPRHTPRTTIPQPHSFAVKVDPSSPLAPHNIPDRVENRVHITHTRKVSKSLSLIFRFSISRFSNFPSPISSPHSSLLRNNATQLSQNTSEFPSPDLSLEMHTVILSLPHLLKPLFQSPKTSIGENTKHRLFLL